jgi:ribosome-binding factor A
MTHRIEKIESTVARAIQQVIARGLNDPRAGGLISVTRVDVSPDMANAMVFISVYPEEKQAMSMHALRHAAKHIRHEAAELIAIRKMPLIEFRVDKTLKQQAEVYDALAKARDSGQPPPPSGSSASDAAPPPSDTARANDDGTHADSKEPQE